MYLCTRRVVLFYAHFQLPALFLLKIVPRITSHRPPRKVDDGSPRITAHHPLPDVFQLRKMRGVTRITAHHLASPCITSNFYRSVETRSMVLVSFRFSTEHLWLVIVPLWLSTEYICIQPISIYINENIPLNLVMLYLHLIPGGVFWKLIFF